MDIKNNRFVSLEDIASHYSCVLIDACSFQLHSKNIKDKSVKEKLDFYLEDIKYLKFWNENIKSFCNLYTTLKIIEEMEGESYKYTKSIKKMTKIPFVLELRRAIRDYYKERNCLINNMRDEQRILEFNEREQNRYNYLYENFFDIEENRKVGDIDYDLVISGLTLFNSRGSSAIISNDSGIVDVWRDISEKKSFSKDRFGVFRREKLDTFKILGL